MSDTLEDVFSFDIFYKKYNFPFAYYFRLWLTSRPTEHFSVPTLQLGVKVAIEEPTIVRTSLTRHLFPEKGFITKVKKR